jgi:hypothetical protein
MKLTEGNEYDVTSPLKTNEAIGSKALAMGKVRVQPVILMSISSNQGENFRPPNIPLLQSRCSRVVVQGTTQANPDSSSKNFQMCNNVSITVDITLEVSLYFLIF